MNRSISGSFSLGSGASQNHTFDFRGSGGQLNIASLRTFVNVTGNTTGANGSIAMIPMIDVNGTLVPCSTGIGTPGVIDFTIGTGVFCGDTGSSSAPVAADGVRITVTGGTGGTTQYNKVSIVCDVGGVLVAS